MTVVNKSVYCECPHDKSVRKRTTLGHLIMDVSIQVLWRATDCQQGVDDVNKTLAKHDMFSKSNLCHHFWLKTVKISVSKHQRLQKSRAESSQWWSARRPTTPRGHDCAVFSSWASNVMPRVAVCSPRFTTRSLTTMKGTRPLLIQSLRLAFVAVQNVAKKHVASQFLLRF